MTELEEFRRELAVHLRELADLIEGRLPVKNTDDGDPAANPFE